MGTVDWSSVDPRPEGSGNGKGLFLKLESNKEYKIRPVGKPIEVRRYFVDGPNGKKSVAVTDGKDECIILRKYRKDDGDPMYPQQTRYAFNCIDRADGQLKVVQVPVTVARFIRDWGAEMGLNPGSSKGADFKIKVECQGSDKRNTRYHTLPLAQTPFSEDEKKLLEQGLHDLDKLFKPTPQDQIEAALGLSGGSSPASPVAGDDEEFAPKGKTQPKAAGAKPASKATVPADDDDAFGNF